MEQEEEYNQEVPEGFVISQIPPYRESGTVKEKSTIKIVVSKGQETTVVPKVAGMKKEEAIQAIEEAKLKVQVVEETSKTIEAGYVITQEPAEKTEINAGETITIKVSTGTGIKQVSVPYVVTKTEEEARKTLTDSGLKIKQVIYTEDTTKDDGKVVKQDIEAGSTVDEGTEVTITVNKIPQVKTGSVKINVKSITGYEEPEKEKDDNTTTDTTTKPTPAPTPRQVTLKVLVNEEQVEEKKVSEASTNETIKVQGIGTITIKVYINGNLKRTEQLNLNDKDTLTIE